jgi:hypothetical protein
MTERNNSPSPVSYRVAESLEKNHLDKSNRYYSIGKEKKVLFTESHLEKKKVIPGVGKYENHLALDKVARPMKSYR